MIMGRIMIRFILPLDHGVQSMDRVTTHKGRRGVQLCTSLSGSNRIVGGDYRRVGDGSSCSRHRHECRHPNRVRHTRRLAIAHRLMQPTPNLDEERALIPERHLGSLAVVKVAQVFEPALDVPRATLALQHVAINDIQRLGSV